MNHPGRRKTLLIVRFLDSIDILLSSLLQMEKCVDTQLCFGLLIEVVGDERLTPKLSN